MNKIYLKLIAIMILCLSFSRANAQSCSVNAGVDRTICSQGVMTLSGNSTGAIAVVAKWALVSGPNVPTITAPGSAVTTVTGFVPGVYLFRYFARCSDAVDVADSVTVTVEAAPVFSAGNDTFVCGNSANLHASLPSGASGIWTSSVISNVSNPLFGSPTSPTSNVSISNSNTTCPKRLNVIWSVTRGACVLYDTAVVSFGGQSSFSTIADQSICGTSYRTPDYNIGCGGTLTATEISGPNAATIAYTYGAGSPLNNTMTYATYSGLVVGAYTFATQAINCSGVIFRDTFVITVSGTVALTNTGISNKDLCITSFDTAYLFNPTASLLPGETISWNTVSVVKTPASLPNPTVAVIGNSLRVSDVTHPDTFATTGFYRYRYQYTINNGLCSRTNDVDLILRTPMKTTIFNDVINQPCGVDTVVLTQFISGSPALNYDQTTLISKPSGTVNPTVSESGSATRLSKMSPGKYIYSFRYRVASCEYRNKTVEINISKKTGLSNAGTDQVLPCLATSTTLAGNLPDTAEVGTWLQVSGPAGTTLASPHSNSLGITGLAVGTYTFRWAISSGSGCVANSDDVNIIVSTTTPAANAGLDDTVCAGNSVPLLGNPFGPGVTAKWRQVSGPAVTINDSTSANTFFSGSVVSSVYKFVYILNDPCGTTKDTVIITTDATSGSSDAVISTANTCLTSSSSVTLTAIAPTTGSGAWSQLSGPGAASIATPASNSTLISGLMAGTYKFIWSTSSVGCDTKTDTVIISYSPLALTANAGPDQSICDTVLTMAATATSPAGIIGTWSQFGGAGTIIASPNSPTTTITGLKYGSTYDYIWTVSAGAESVCPVAKDSVHISVSTPVSPAVAMADTLLCNTSSINLPITATAPVSGIGSWSVLESPVGFSTSVANVTSNATTAAISGGVTRLIWQIGGGGACPSSYDTVRIEAVPTPNAGADRNTCDVSNILLTGSSKASGTVLWTQISGPSTAVFSQETATTTSASSLVQGTYFFKYTLTHPTCGGSDTIKIINYGKPKANAGPNASYCWVPPSATFPLTADTTGGVGAATVTWSRFFGAGGVTFTPSATVATTSATVTAPGLHQFLLTVSNPGCTAQDYVDIFIDKPTALGFTLTPRAACNDTFLITASVPVDGYTYKWQFPTGQDTVITGTNLRSVPNRFLTKGFNKVYLTLTNPATLCTFRDSTTIYVCKSVIPPIANNITAAPMNSSNDITPIPQLKASNPSGTPIRSYSVLTLPPATQGVLYYCAAAPSACASGTLSLVAVGTTLTPDQSATLNFDPAANFKGNVQFTYNAIDTNDLTSNIATYTIPVFNNAPVTHNIVSAIINKGDVATLIPSLLSADADGTVDSFIFLSIPPSSIGVLSFCSNSTEPCTGTVTPISSGRTISKAQMSTLKFDPNASFSGNYTYEYQSKDNSGNVSNTSSYIIPVSDIWIFLGNYSPVANNITSQQISNNSGSTPIPNLRGTDPDGTVISYTIGSSVPNSTTEGTLSYCASPGVGCILSAVTPGLSISPAQAMTLKFDPVAGFIGNATFTYTAKDNFTAANISEPATYIIPIVNMPPVANPTSVNPIVNTKTTPTLLPPLSGYDVDGTVVSYRILDVPPFSQGILKYCATAPGTPCTDATLSMITAALSNLTADQMSTLNFIPNAGDTGDYVFHFATVDNNGLQSQAAAFTIPVIEFAVTSGAPPIAYSFNNPTINSSTSALLATALTGTDPDGSVDSFFITTITPANEGLLTYCTTPPTGCSTLVTAGMYLSPAQAATVRFTPAANFTGVSTFNYINKDNLGNPSNTATVTIPVINNPPTAINVTNSSISRTATTPSTLNPLSATDQDGTISSYRILTIPSANEGILRLCATPPSTSCTDVVVNQVLTPAEVGNLAFTPNVANHSPVITFLYAAMDNSGNRSNTAAQNIPVSDALVLPLDLLSFTATKQSANAFLEWEIGVESATEYIVQHSLDGKEWKSLGSKPANGSVHYNFTHQNAPNGNNYYRLKLQELGSKFTYSPVRVLNFENSNNYTISIQPNPIENRLFIISNDGSEIAAVTVFSNEGRKIMEVKNLNSGAYIDMESYTSGLYIIKVTDKSGAVSNFKISKK